MPVMVPAGMMSEPPECDGDEPPPAGTAPRSAGRCQAAGVLHGSETRSLIIVTGLLSSPVTIGVT